MYIHIYIHIYIYVYLYIYMCVCVCIILKNHKPPEVCKGTKERQAHAGRKPTSILHCDLYPIGFSIGYKWQLRLSTRTRSLLASSGSSSGDQRRHLLLELLLFLLLLDSCHRHCPPATHHSWHKGQPRQHGRLPRGEEQAEGLAGKCEKACDLHRTKKHLVSWSHGQMSNWIQEEMSTWWMKPDTTKSVSHPARREWNNQFWPRSLFVVVFGIW